MSSPDRAAIFALHRYFIWSEQMREHYFAVVTRTGRIPEVRSPDGIRAFLYMSYWYGGLYVVVEGWRELSLSDDAIDTLLQSSNVDLLRRYRHGAFHYQCQYFDARFTDFWQPEAGTVTWVQKLRSELSRWFLAHSGERGR
jgi:hypothetical protein